MSETKYNPKRFQDECISGMIFNGNENEFFRNIVYGVGVELGMTGIDIIRNPEVREYTLKAHALPHQGSKTELMASMIHSVSGSKKLVEDKATFTFGGNYLGFVVNYETEIIDKGKINKALEFVIKKLDK